ncbi:MAG: hypothetical protein VYC80_05610, partial [Planctomycetota bacterium]|nr:hypothetical protein [Planctomycetota bacterium]
ACESVWQMADYLVAEDALHDDGPPDHHSDHPHHAASEHAASETALLARGIPHPSGVAPITRRA